MADPGLKLSRTLCSAAAVTAAVALIASTNAAASELEPDGSSGRTPSQLSAKAGSEAAAIKELQRRLDQRDDFILDLLERVQRLERQMAIRAPSVGRAVNAALSVSTDGSSSIAADEAPRSAQQNPPQPRPQNPPQSTQQNSPESGAPQAGPGQFEVSEEDAQRALERALVQTGASLLFPGKFELVPSITYQFNQVGRPSQLALTSAGTVLVTEDVLRSTQLEGGLLLRAGLPWDLQAEISLPYDYKRFSTASRVLGSNLSDVSASASGMGDPTFSLTKQVLREGEWRPGLFLSGTWDSDFGQTRNHIALGSGFNEFRGSVTAVKRQDPLVFTTSFTYQTALESHNVAPGDQFIPAVGMLFAVSPETSLRFAQQLDFVRPIKVGGNTVPGTDQLQGIFSVGLLSILARGLVMDFNVSIGETPDAPDLTIRMGFPIRLN